MNDKKVTVLEPMENIGITITMDKLIKHFKLPYANTRDSVQGLSGISKKITIFGCITPYVDRYFIWTALTRTRNLKNVQVFQTFERRTNVSKKSWGKLHFTQKINCYKQQDMIS